MEGEKMAAKLIFTAVNNHSEECGEPPALKNRGAHQYCGYFENMHGEQWLFVYDKIQHARDFWMSYEDSSMMSRRNPPPKSWSSMSFPPKLKSSR